MVTWHHEHVTNNAVTFSSTIRKCPRGWVPYSAFKTLANTSQAVTVTYLQLHFLEIKHADLGDFADDVESVVLLVGDRIPQQTEDYEDMTKMRHKVGGNVTTLETAVTKNGGVKERTPHT